MTYPCRLLACVLTALVAKDAEGSRWVHDGHTMEPPPDALRAFRRSLYECLHRRGDALFELTDAILSPDASAPSPVHLSLQPAHRRGWGSFYAALARGRIDAEVLRDLLVRHPLAGSAATTPVYAVDTSVWPRGDAECSPERGYYYHPSRNSAGQPIVAGWAYQFVAQLNFVRESWTAPLDVERVLPAQDANEVAAEQVKALLDRLGKGRTAFPCSSSMRATTLSRCSRDWRGARARSSSACAPGAASTATQVCATRRNTSDAPVATDLR
jgi:hypothetical protein